MTWAVIGTPSFLLFFIDRPAEYFFGTQGVDSVLGGGFQCDGLIHNVVLYECGMV